MGRGKALLIHMGYIAGHQDAATAKKLRPVVEWDDCEEMLRYYRPDRIADQLSALQSRVTSLRENLTRDRSFGDLAGCSQKFLQVRELLARAAESRVTVLLLGETGVGNDLFARALHQRSPLRHRRGVWRVRDP